MAHFVVLKTVICSIALHYVKFFSFTEELILVKLSDEPLYEHLEYIAANERRKIWA